MAMRVSTRTSRDALVTLAFSSPQELLQFGGNLRCLIAQRAYELYEVRGRRQGHHIDDWLDAEGEIVTPCRHSLAESAKSVLFRVELPGRFTPDQVKVSIEPQRLILGAQRELLVPFSGPGGTVTKPEMQRIFHIENLPVVVDPSRSRAFLGFEKLQIEMPTLDVPNERPRMPREKEYRAG